MGVGCGSLVLTKRWLGIVLVGDAAHMATPRTGSGADTAVLDALGLWEAFSSTGMDDVDHALRTYDFEAVRRAKELYWHSCALSQQFLPPGGVKAVKQSP